MHRVTVIVAAVLLVAQCGGANPSVSEYVDALNAMNEEFSPQGEANYFEFTSVAEPSLDDLRSLLEANVALRVDVQDALESLDAPAQIEDLNDSWVRWHAGFLEASEAQSARAATVASWDEFLNSSEFDAWGASMRDGAVLCADIEARLNSTEAEDMFAGTAWMPSELTEVVHAVIGCENFPDDLDDLASIYGR